MTKKNKLCISGIAIAVVIAVLVLIIISVCRNNETGSEADYFSVLSLSGTGCNYEELVSVWGEPNKISEEDAIPGQGSGVHVLDAEYDGFTAVFITENSEPGYNEIISSLKIYSDEFKFGKYGISVGSSRDVVEAAYKKSPKTEKTEDTENSLCYKNEESISAKYVFDENGTVKELRLFW